jgi:hypothetical protein
MIWGASGSASGNQKWMINSVNQWCAPDFSQWLMNRGQSLHGGASKVSQ